MTLSSINKTSAVLEAPR